MRLDGTARKIELEPGYALIAPGLVGMAEIEAGRAPHSRAGGVEKATPALDEAMRLSGLSEVRSIVISATSQPVPPAEELRGADGEPALALEVPDQGAEVGQLVMLVDEEGVVSWHYPEPGPPLGAARGRAVKRFVLRRYCPPQPPQPGANRGLFGFVGRKILKVLVYPIVDPILGHVAEALAGRWEAKKRPYGLHRLDANNYEDGGRPMTAADWRELAAGRALLFVHGTFSTARGAFGGLPRETMAALGELYAGRVFAFNHFSLSHSLQQNSRWFMEQVTPALAEGERLRLDIICHSRGGLVARALAAEAAAQLDPRIAIDRVVFVAAPNHGTALADGDHMVQFLDRYTSMLNLAPPGPASVVTEVLEGVLIVVKVIGHAALESLPGLLAMHPQRMQPLMDAETLQGFAIASNFEPGDGMKQLVRVADSVLDRVFGDAANDLIVPTQGVYGGSESSLFPIPTERVLRLDANRAVWHGAFFTQPEVDRQLIAWLGSN